MTCIFILVLFFGPSLIQATPTPDFPVGLSLTHQITTEYYMNTITYTETFDVLKWLSPSNSSLQIRYTRVQGASSQEELRDVSYPYWNYTYYDADLNETVELSMYPLWLDVSDWGLGQIQSICYGTYSSREYTIASKETVEVGDVVVECWAAETSFEDGNGWNYIDTHCYDTQYGILIKSYGSRYAGSDYYNNARSTNTLISSNVSDIIAYHYPPNNTLDALLISGIIVETTVLIVLSIIKKRRTIAT